MNIKTTKSEKLSVSQREPLICIPIILSYLSNSPYFTNENGLIRLFEHICGLIFIYLVTENENGPCILAVVGV